MNKPASKTPGQKLCQGEIGEISLRELGIDATENGFYHECRSGFNIYFLPQRMEYRYALNPENWVKESRQQLTKRPGSRRSFKVDALMDPDDPTSKVSFILKPVRSPKDKVVKAFAKTGDFPTEVDPGENIKKAMEMREQIFHADEGIVVRMETPVGYLSEYRRGLFRWRKVEYEVYLFEPDCQNRLDFCTKKGHPKQSCFDVLTPEEVREFGQIISADENFIRTNRDPRTNEVVREPVYVVATHLDVERFRLTERCIDKYLEASAKAGWNDRDTRALIDVVYKTDSRRRVVAIKFDSEHSKKT
ncbi:MAG: hypothetical protein V1703_03155 [Candidatus Altiarchaeota archaeon]